METLQRTANRGSISTGYDIDNSLKIEADNAERMQRTYANITSAGTPTSTKIATISFWIKRTELQPSGNHLCFIADSNFTWIGFNNDGLYILGSTAGINLRSNGKFRDTSAWYHIVVAFDTTQSTASNRVKVYVNGEQWTEFGVSENYGTQNNDIDLYDNNTSHYLGWSDAQSQSGYYSEFYLIDGQQLAPTEFGETDSDSGIWKPKAYDGTFGVQGYHLDFEDSSNLGLDVSGNSNNFTALYSITAADQATDTPTNNFATMNVIWGTNRMPLMSEGATEIGNNVSDYRYSTATIGVTSGKWYWEIKPTVNGNTLVSGAGIGSNQTTLFFYDETGNFVYHYDASKYVNGAAASYGAAWATNDIIGFAYDADNWTLTCYVNNSSQGNLLAGQTDISSELFIPYVYSFGTHTYQTNFGGYTTMSNTHTNTDANGYGSFVYAPPSGYYALCTKNLAEYG